MKFTTSLATALACIPVLAPAAHAAPLDSLALPYRGVKVLRVPTGPSGDALEELKALIDRLDLQVWTTVPKINSHIDLQVPSGQLGEFTEEVTGIMEKSGASTNGYDLEVMHDDLAESVLNESKGMNSPVVDKITGLANDAWFDSYHRYADHLTFINDLAAAYPNNTRIVTSGTSVEGRTITGINIFGSSGSGTKPAVIWHGTVHAREWISSMTVEYLAYQLLTGYGNSTTELVDKYDFYIFPVVNPDGFVYSHALLRLWRKNRQTPPSGSKCYGRDINRNWNSQWSADGGASTDPCDDTYKGLAAVDAPETTGLTAFVNERIKNPAGVISYIDWHSYSQLFMSPWGYSCTSVPSDNDELTKLAAEAGTTIAAVNGTQFKTGPICSTLYMTTGNSVDYAYDNGIKYSFAVELRDTGLYGFVIPPDQIRASGDEIWAGVEYLYANLKVK